MKKRIVLALLLVFVMALTASCSLIVKDPEVDKQTVVLEVNGQPFVKGDVQQLIENELDYQVYLYSYQYGETLDRNDPELVSYVQDAAFDSIVQRAVIEEKLQKDGYTVLAPEEEEAVQAAAQAEYDSYIEEVLTYDLADSELSDEEKRAEAEKLLPQFGYPSMAMLLEQERIAAAEEKLYQEIVKDVTLTEEDLIAAYDQYVATAKADYEFDIGYFESDVENGAQIYYYPAGYRYVKHILIGFPDEEYDALMSMTTDVLLAQQALTDAQDKLNAAGEEEKEEALAAQQAAEAALIDAQSKLDEARDVAYTALQPRVDEVQAAIAAGEEFDALIEKYGEDEGMKVEPAKTRGYVIGTESTNYVDAFHEGAMALAAVGDVSEPVRTEYGVHLIKYVEEIPEGAVPFDSVRAQLAADELKYRQDEVYQTAVEQWVKEADVKMYKNRMAD
ncbi:MAG: peptidylprolyl isomerase [Clostridia bacterium]|nr:peptidylprolyl isomerase [Clostridia bacterium]